MASGYSAIFANNLHSEPAEAATWLDQAIPADKKPIIHEKGFGPVVSKALVAREEWLIANRHASVEQPGTIMPKPDMLRELKNRGITVAAEKISAQLGMPHHAPLQGLRMTGKLVGTVEPPMPHLAVIKGGKEFTLVPWRPELLKMRDKEIDISVRDRTIAMVPRVDEFGTSGYRDKANGSSKDLGPPSAGVPPYRAGPTASATEPRSWWASPPRIAGLGG